MWRGFLAILTKPKTTAAAAAAYRRWQASRVPSQSSPPPIFRAMASAASSEPPPGAGDEEGKGLSKKAEKKLKLKAEKEKRRQEYAAASAVESAAASAPKPTAADVAAVEIKDPLAANYGDVELTDLQSRAVTGRVWTEVQSLDNELVGKSVLVRGRVESSRNVGKKMLFIVLRHRGYTVQCVMTVAEGLVSEQMVGFSAAISRESIVDVEGVVSLPGKELTGATQQVEVQMRKIYCVNRAMPNLPISVEDASRSEQEIEEAKKKGGLLVGVSRDNRLNYRVLDMRTAANQAIFRIEGQVELFFMEHLFKNGFTNIKTPKLIGGSSEGGSAVFSLDYKGQPACLAQSPQLHKQMALCGDFERVFVVGPVFRAEDSFTHRHLCEFNGLDVEMEIKEHYSEVMDVVDELFVALFDMLNEKCQKELKAVGKQYPFTPLKYLRKTLQLTFEEGVQILKEAGVEIDPFGDLNTESERRLGQLVAEKYETDFYILHRYPLAVRPFYTMPCFDNPAYSNSFDVFIRGEEIISGAQRVHVPDILAERAKECGINVDTLTTYIDSFRYGTPPHGGFGVGLERVVMLFLGLENIRQTSLYPRDPKRLSP